MYNEHESTLPAGMTRRQLLQRGAMIGGGVLAAQSLGVVSAFAQTSSPPPPPTDPPDPPPTDPPVDPPTDPPVDPTDPPVDPTDPPVDPATDPPSDPADDPTERTSSVASTIDTSSTSRDPATPAASSRKVARSSDPATTERVASGGIGGALPHTGASIPTLLASGGAALAAGTALVRRRGTTEGDTTEGGPAGPETTEPTDGPD